LLLCTILIVILAIRDKSSWRNLGVYKDRLLKFYLPYILFTLIGAVFIYIVAESIGSEPLYWDGRYLFTILVIPISFSQEFIYRGYLMNKLANLFKSPAAIILINAGLFAFLHIIFNQALIVLPLTFIGGLALAWMYKKYPNLILISIAHSILNFIAVILYGFFN
jgi:hypothetical protein